MTTPRLAWGLLKVGSLASSESPCVALLDVSERNWHLPGIGCTVTWWFILGNHQDLVKDGIQVFGVEVDPDLLELDAIQRCGSSSGTGKQLLVDLLQ
jgi:hypothetical protein